MVFLFRKPPVRINFAQNILTMKHILFLFAFAFLFASCSTDDAPIEDGATTAADAEKQNEERLQQVAPPPPVCVYLTEAEVLSYFEPGVQIPMAGSRAPSSFNSCQYTIDGKEWSGFLVLDMPEANLKVQSIRDEVAGATGADAVMVGEYKGRILNDGRVLSVEAQKPFRVKFSALPKVGFPEAFDSGQRRELIQKLALAVVQ